MKMKKHAVYAILAMVSLLGLGITQSAKAAPVLNAGFSGDTITAANTDSLGSPYIFAFLFPTQFSITDAFIVGDTYKVYDGATLILTTTFQGPGAPFATPGDPIGEAAWTSGSYTIGSIMLAAGPHLIRVQGDGVGGLPAGFYDRIDTVPDAGSTLALLGFASLGLVALRRKLGC